MSSTSTHLPSSTRSLFCFENKVFFVFLLISLPFVLLASIYHPVLMLLPFLIASIILLFEKPIWGFWGLFFIVLLGQFLRVTVSGAGGLLFLDLFTPLFILIWLLKKISLDRDFPSFHLKSYFFAFLSYAFLSLIFGIRYLSSWQEIIFSGFYLFRFFIYGVLYFLARDLFRNSTDAKRMTKAALNVGVILAIFGFVQLLIYPDFGKMAELGWDPHVGRLLSTWFDPNYCAGFFAFMTMISLGVLTETRDKKERRKLFFAIAVFVLALFLTYSRSGYLSLAIPLFIFCLLRARKVLLIMLICITLVIAFSERTQKRVLGMTTSMIAILTNSSETTDATASMRIESWKLAAGAIQENPFLGIGFNTFRYYGIEHGLVSKVEKNSAGGSDSSILNMFVMTGILGGILYLALLIKMFTSAFLTYRKAEGFKKGLAIGFIFAFLALILHSFFVNSLLFPFIMVFVWIFAALVEE